MTAKTQDLTEQLEKLRLAFGQQTTEYRQQVLREFERQQDQIDSNRAAIVELRIAVAIARTKMAMWSVAGASAVAAVTIAIVELVLK